MLYSSAANDLVPGLIDPNGDSFSDLFLYDRGTGISTLVSHASHSTTTTANRGSTAVAITPDGRFVLFSSEAYNLVADVTDGSFSRDAFVHDRLTGDNSLVSRSAASASVTANAASIPVAITPDGNHVLFQGFATNLVAGQIDVALTPDSFVHDRSTGTTTLISHAAGAPLMAANDDSQPVAISDDGRFVLFDSMATNHLGNYTDANGVFDVYLYDRQSMNHQAVSASAAVANATGNGASSANALSVDGRRVLFESGATDLIIGMIDPKFGSRNVFTFDRVDGTRTLISHAAGQPSEGGNAVSVATGLSSSGLRVLFQSHAGNLVEGASDDDFDPDAFVQDLEEIGPVLVSHAVGAPMVPADLGAEAVGISADGSTVLLFSASADLDADTLNGYGYENIYSVRLDPRTALFVDGFE